MQSLTCAIANGVIILIYVLCFGRHTQIVSYVSRAVPRPWTIHKGQLNCPFLGHAKHKFTALGLSKACDTTINATGISHDRLGLLYSVSQPTDYDVSPR